MVVELETVDAGLRSACGQYSLCWFCRAFSLTFETWHQQPYTNELLSSSDLQVRKTHWPLPPAPVRDQVGPGGGWAWTSRANPAKPAAAPESRTGQYLIAERVLRSGGKSHGPSPAVIADAHGSIHRLTCCREVIRRAGD